MFPHVCWDLSDQTPTWGRGNMMKVDKHFALISVKEEKPVLNRTILAALVLASLAILAPALVNADPIISAPNVTASVGDTVTIPISITDAVDLQFFQFDLSFAPLVVQANTAGATAGALLPGDWFFTSPGTVDNTGGQILGVSAFGSAVSGSGVIADIEFQAIAPGTSPLTFQNVQLNLSDTGFTTTDGQITVTATAPVPEPETLVLLTSGLGLLGMQRLAGRRRRDDA